jgi:glyoxylase-like metal-dependent hydrolase (beta-lactamase superfamily II)
MRILPHIHQVDGVNGNCYILVRDGLTVIDTGLPGSGKKILACIRDQLHRDPAEIRTILITHFHIDHVGGLAAVKGAVPKAIIGIGRQDAGYVDGSLPLPVHPGLRGLLLHLFGHIMGPVHFTPDLVLDDGDRIGGLLCIALPGHTPGSMGFFDEPHKALFAGDILRSDGSAVTGGPAQFTMDPARERESLQKIAALDMDLLLPGHGIPLTRGALANMRAFVTGTPPGK